MNMPITDVELQCALKQAIEQIRINLPQFTDHCQAHASINGVYCRCRNTQWSCGFWPGTVWLAYEHTGEDCFLHAANILTESFILRIRQKKRVNHHDMGFLFVPSCVAAYQLTGNRVAREAALLGAEQLLRRFQPKGEFFQAWGRMGSRWNYRFIIDCMMNLPLLYWASRETGDMKYVRAALKHARTCLNLSFRPDGSTYHTFFMCKDGSPKRGRTCQGYRDDSIWARGQAWAIYGTILYYREAGDPQALRLFQKALMCYQLHLPHDLVPFWDMIFLTDNSQPKDSSAAAIAACGVLEAARIPSLPQRESYIEFARCIVGNLKRAYVPQTITERGGLIKRGTYSKSSRYNTCLSIGVNEFTTWGDYFYMEALIRLTTRWKPYW